MIEILTAILIPAACGLAVALPFVMLLRLLLNNRAAKRQALQAHILQSWPGLDASRAFPVNYASEAYFRKWMKPVSWEGSGQLVIQDGGVRYVGQASGQAVEMLFRPADARIKWAGMAIRNGQLFWLAIETGGVRHYFAAETGAFTRGSATATRRVYDELSQVLRPEN